MCRIFIEENYVYQIDFSNAIWATNQLNTIYDNAKTILSDVDFIVETEDTILFVEYKNSDIDNAVNPNGFKPQDDKSINKVVRKFYDSLFYVNSVLDNKLKVYVYILETPKADSFLRGAVRSKLKAKLPFRLQVQNGFKEKLIDDVRVVSILEWNQKYPQFPLTKIVKED